MLRLELTAAQWLTHGGEEVNAADADNLHQNAHEHANVQQQHSA